MDNFVDLVISEYDNDGLLFEPAGRFKQFSEFSLADLQVEFAKRGYKITTYENATEVEKSDYYVMASSRGDVLVYKL